MREQGHSKKTVRQEWTDFSNEIQRDVDETLENLQLEIEAGNAAIADLYKNNSKEWAQLTPQIIEYLDKQWGYIDDRFMVLGKWSEPTIAAGSEGIIAQLEEKQVFRSAISKGFEIYLPHRNNPSSTPRIVMSFVIQSIPMNTQALKGNLLAYAYADPANISLRYMRPQGSEVVSSNNDEVERSIRQADALLQLYTTNENSTFYREGAKKQHALLNSITDMVNNTLPMSSSLDRAILNSAAPSYVYVNSANEGLVPLHANDDESPLIITGEIIGSTLLDGIISPDRDPLRPYKTADELDVAVSGLMLVVNPHMTNLKITGLDYDTILVPARALEKIPLKMI